MYHRIVEQKLRATFGDVNRGNYIPVVNGFAEQGLHWFSGTHALSGERSGPHDIARWYERLALLFPDLTFTIVEVAVRGWPWNTTAMVEWTDKLHDRKGVEFTNSGVHVVKLRWGKIVSLRIYCDTARLAMVLRTLAEQGVDEATKEPIISRSKN
ncbi:nuclear transport factor 2 family protein [Nocardia araoensis]|uniref:nuclear transport factor 2 family protein n=1 Tax=Nocardia araoensis TaxID=228600 RepID=UPI000584845C|nr:nuclear transport factor 2 family protein [Nocardia araoensis]